MENACYPPYFYKKILLYINVDRPFNDGIYDYF